MSVGKSVSRVDAYEKVTGRAKYAEDLTLPSMLTAKVLRSTIANGKVVKIDISEAVKLPGVVKIITCFDVPDIEFPTAGHPWSTDPAHRDPSDRKLLNSRVRFYGDDIGAVIAEDEIAASRALKKIKVEYEEYPPLLTPEASMKAASGGAAPIHKQSPDNILKHSLVEDGDFNASIKENGLIKFEQVFETPIVQHCHIEGVVSYAYTENDRIVVVSSTQIPHIVRRIVAQALGRPWGDIRIIKPYIGGGFGNKQDALYEPLNAFLTVCVGGKPVKIILSREEIFSSTRVRHAEEIRLTAYVRPDGRLVARSYTCYANQGAYGSHGHSTTAKGTNVFRQLYQDEKARRTEAFTVYTNTATGGAMRGYGTPQALFAVESHMEDMALSLNMDPIEFRFKNLMPVGYTDPFTKNVYRQDSFRECVEKCKAYIHWDEKRALYKNQSGQVRKGVGMALFWYNTAVWPISVEISSCRMVLNQDSSIQLQLGETEIGQGADTVFAQMASTALSIPFEKVHVISVQDTDITPFGLGAYGSRQTYVGGMSISKTAGILKEKILKAASGFLQMQIETLDLINGNIVLKTNNEILLSLGELATETLYSTEASEHITAEATTQAKSNAFSFGCTFVEVEVDIPLAKIKLLDIVNAHDAGSLINPQLAAGQVHGGMSMAIGFGLSEQMLYDEKTGRLLNGNLLDYKLCTIMDHPHLEAQFVEHFEPTTPFGTKALGEPPTVAGAPSIRNAVLHATGVALNKIPMTPQNIFPAFKAAGLI